MRRILQSIMNGMHVKCFLPKVKSKSKRAKNHDKALKKMHKLKIARFIKVMCRDVWTFTRRRKWRRLKQKKFLIL